MRPSTRQPTHRRPSSSRTDTAAVRAIAARYLPRTTFLERVPSYNNLVVRLRQPDGDDRILKLARAGERQPAMTREPQVMSLLRQSGVPVPQVEVEDLAGRLVGRPFFIMSCAGDRTAAELSALSSQNRRLLFVEVGRALALIHKVPFREPADFTGHRLIRPKFQRTPLETWHAQQLEYALRHKLLAPARIEEIIAGLAAMPAADSFAMCHGDYNPSQCVRKGPRVTAVVDWEASYVGDPSFDYAVFDVVLETTTPPALAAEARRAYAELRPLPEGYESRYRPLKLAHAVALAATYHINRRTGALRAVLAAVERLASDTPAAPAA